MNSYCYHPCPSTIIISCLDLAVLLTSIPGPLWYILQRAVSMDLQHVLDHTPLLRTHQSFSSLSKSCTAARLLLIWSSLISLTFCYLSWFPLWFLFYVKHPLTTGTLYQIFSILELIPDCHQLSFRDILPEKHYTI